jgi:hypothetical protein
MLSTGQRYSYHYTYMVANTNIHRKITRCHLCQVVYAQQLVADDKIGDLIYAKAHYWESLKTLEMVQLLVSYPLTSVFVYRTPFASDIKNDPDEHNWRHNADRVGGGVLVDGSSHWIRPLRMWLDYSFIS